MGSLQFQRQQNKDKVIIVMGATGSGKSKLSIDMATNFPAEIVNSDKMQVYKGLDIVTNKVTAEECRGVPHHLLGIVDQDVDFTAADFCHHVTRAVGSITDKGKIPIIAGGSNSYIEELVNKDTHFKRRYETLFLWVDVSLPVLERFVSDRVDQMVESGLVDEVRGISKPDADYTRGIRRAIGVPELDRFLKAVKSDDADDETLARLLKEAVGQIKQNTYKLACRQRGKILRLRNAWGWELHQINATKVFEKRGKPEAVEIWKKEVVQPSMKLVDRFLTGSDKPAGNEHHRSRPYISRQPLQMRLTSQVSQSNGQRGL